MKRILSFFDQLEKAPTQGVEPTFHLLELTNIFREDSPREAATEGVLANVPEMKGRYVKAPKMG